MHNRIGIVGDADSILAFKAIGVETFGVSDADEAKEYIKEMARKDFKVIFVTENYAEKLEEFLEKFRSRPFPSIIPVPSAKGSTGYGMEGVRKDMEKAIGADILFRKD